MKGAKGMKLKINYCFETSEDDFEGMKQALGVDTDAEFIGLMKAAIKTQQQEGCKVVGINIEIEHDACSSANLN